MEAFLHKLARIGGRVWFAAAVCLVLSAAALPFDHAVSDWVRLMTAGRTGELVRLVGGLGHGLTLSVVFVMLLVLYGEDRVGAEGLIGIFWAGIAADVLRAVIGRRRPDGDHFSFPSAHTACAFAAAVVLARRWPGLRGAFYLAAAGVGAARVLWLRHFPADVLAGAAVGMAFGVMSVPIADSIPLLARPAAMRKVKTVLAGLLIVSVFVVRSWPEPLATLAPPALLLVAARRVGVMLGPRLSHDG